MGNNNTSFLAYPQSERKFVEEKIKTFVRYFKNNLKTSDKGLYRSKKKDVSVNLYAVPLSRRRIGPAFHEDQVLERIASSRISGMLLGLHLSLRMSTPRRGTLPVRGGRKERTSRQESSCPCS